MFHPSPQHAYLHQQIISLSQKYPCPRCMQGTLEAYGITETFACSRCQRGFVPLRGGTLLCPSCNLGWKIAPTFWWDGLRWHWSGTTATAAQLLVIVLISLIPAVGILIASTIVEPQSPWWKASLFASLAGFITMQFIYFLCWDFDFFFRAGHKKDNQE